jgi:hypothetical protein
MEYLQSSNWLLQRKTYLLRQSTISERINSQLKQLLAIIRMSI